MQAAAPALGEQGGEDLVGNGVRVVGEREVLLVPDGVGLGALDVPAGVVPPGAAADGDERGDEVVPLRVPVGGVELEGLLVLDAHDATDSDEVGQCRAVG